MKHSLKHLLFAISLTLSVLFSGTALVSATNYTNTYNIGKKVFKVVVSGSGTSMVSTLYEQKSSSDVKLATYKTKSVRPITTYGDYLYMDLTSVYDFEDTTVSRINLKTKEKSTVQKRAHISLNEIKGRYAIASQPTGYALALSYYVIDFKTGKSKLISKKCYGAHISGKTVYYITVDKNYRGKVYKCTPTLKNKKAVSGTIQTSEGYGTKVRPKYIAYGKRAKNYSVQYYKYTYSTKKTKKISQTAYYNIK